MTEVPVRVTTVSLNKPACCRVDTTGSVPRVTGTLSEFPVVRLVNTKCTPLGVRVMPAWYAWGPDVKGCSPSILAPRCIVAFTPWANEPGHSCWTITVALNAELVGFTRVNVMMSCCPWANAPFTSVTLEMYSPMLDGFLVVLVTGLLTGVPESIAKTTPFVAADAEPDEFVKVPVAVTPALLPPALKELI